MGPILSTLMVLPGDLNLLHTDAQYASESVFGERITYRMCGFSMAGVFFVRLNILEGPVVALYVIDHCRFRAPIKIGNRIHVVAKVWKRRIKERGQGIITY